MPSPNPNIESGHDPAYDRISSFLERSPSTSGAQRVVDLVRLFESIGACRPAEGPSPEKSLHGSIDRAERLLKVINSPETIANLLATSLFYTADKRKALRDVTAFVLKLGDISIGGKIAALVTEHTKAVDHTLGSDSGDYRTTRHKRGPVPGWSIAHEVLIQVGRLLHQRPDSGDTFKLFFGALNAGLACAKSELHKQTLVRHAAMILEASTLPGRKYFLDHGVMREVLRVGDDTTNLLRIEKLVLGIATQGFRQGNNILEYLNLKNFGLLAHRPNGAPPYRLLVSFKDAADSFSSKLLAGPVQFSMALRAMAAILEEPIDRDGGEERFEEVAKINFRTAIVLSQAAIEVPLRERLDETPSYDSARVSAIAEELLDKYFTDFSESAKANLATLQLEIAAVLQTAHTQGREQYRLMHASRVLAPYRSLFGEPGEFADAIRHLAFDREISELALRSLPVLTRYFDDRYGGGEAARGFFKLKNLTDLEGMLEAAQKIVALKPGQEVRTLRVASELLEVMYRTQRKPWVTNPVACIQQVYEYFTLFGVEALPFTFVAFLASKENKPIEPILTSFLERQLHSPEALASSFHILRPYVASSPFTQADDGMLDKARQSGELDSEAWGFVLASKLVSHLMSSKEQTGQSIPETVLSSAELEALCSHLRGQSYSELYGLKNSVPNPLTAIVLSSKPPTVEAFVSAYQAARKQLRGVQRSDDNTPSLGLDPLSAEVMLHAQGVLHREFTVEERKAWPAVGLRSGTASVHQVSKATVGIAIHTPHKFEFSRTQEGPLLKLPVQFERVSELLVHRGVAPDTSNHPARIWDTVVRSIESSVLNARELRDGAFLREWRKLRPGAHPADPSDNQLIAALKRAKNLPQWLDTAATAHATQRLTPEFLDWASMGLVANVDEIAMPEMAEVIGDRNAPLVSRARALIELFGASINGRDGSSGVFQNKYQVVRLAQDVFRLSTLTQMVRAYELRPDEHELIRIGTQLTRGPAFTNLGAICETCATRLASPASTRRNMLFMPYIYLDAPLHEPLLAGGTGVLSVYDTDNNPCLLMRGINPRSTLLGLVPASEIYEQTANYLWELAKIMGYAKVLAPDDYTTGRVLTNRPEILHHQHAKYGSNPCASLLDPGEAVFNGNEIKLPCREIRIVASYKP